MAIQYPHRIGARPPTWPIYLNRSSPLADGLIYCGVPFAGPKAGGIDVRDIGPNRITVDHYSTLPTLDIVPELHAYGLRMDADREAALITAPASVKINMPLTIAVGIVRLAAFPANCAIVGTTYDDAAGSPYLGYQFANFSTAGDSHIGFAVNDGGALAAYNQGMPYCALPTVGQHYIVSAHISGTNQKIYRDGQELMSGTYTPGGSTINYAATAQLAYGEGAPNTRNPQSIVTFFAVWNRVLTPHEHWMLGDPATRWSLFSQRGAPVARKTGGNTTGVGDATGSATADGYGVSKAEADGDATASSDAVGYSSAGTYGLAVGSSTAEAFGVSKAEADGLAEGSSTARGLALGWDRGGGASVPRRGSGGRTFRGRRLGGGGGGGSVAANPSPPAGDAIQRLLATMAVGEFKRLNTRNLPSGGTNNANMKSGPAYLQGLDIYTRTYYDAVYPGSPPLWANEGDQNSFIFGTVGGGNVDTDNMRLGYSGVAYNYTAHKVLAYGGGHSSGGWTHGIIFDCLAAAQDILDAGTGAARLWDQYTDPAPYDDVRDTAWPDVTAGWEPETILWPQTISGATRTRLGPDPNLAPFALHNYGAICHDPATDMYYVGGGSVADNQGGIGPDAFWKVNPTTREVTMSTAFGGGNFPFIVSPPVLDGNYMFMTATGTVVVRYDIGGDSASTIGTQGSSLTNASSVNPMWIENLTEAGKYDLVCAAQENVRLFTVHPKLWPAGAAQAGITYPVGNGGSTTADATYFTFEAGVTRRWDDLSGRTWVPDEQKIFVMGFTGTKTVDAELLIQTIDPFVGGATSAERWHVDNWLSGSYTGDVPPGPFSADDEFGHGWQNKFIDLGADYKAFIAVFGAFGDVILIKRAAL